MQPGEWQNGKIMMGEGVQDFEKERFLLFGLGVCLLKLYNK